MQLRQALLQSSVLIAAVTAPLIAWSGSCNEPPGSGGQQEVDVPEPEQEQASAKERLLEHMKKVEEHLKGLRRSVRKPEKVDESLGHTVAMQEHAWSCKAIDPPMAVAIPEESRAAFVVEYRKAMVELLQELLNLEAALLNGEHDKAQDLYKVLKDLEAAGHERFMPEE